MAKKKNSNQQQLIFINSRKKSGTMQEWRPFINVYETAMLLHGSLFGYLIIIV